MTRMEVTMLENQSKRILTWPKSLLQLEDCSRCWMLYLANRMDGRRKEIGVLYFESALFIAHLRRNIWGIFFFHVPASSRSFFLRVSEDGPMCFFGYAVIPPFHMAFSRLSFPDLIEETIMMI